MPIALPAGLAAEALAGFLIVAAALAIAVLVGDILGSLPIIGPGLQGRINSAVLSAIAHVVQWSVEAAEGLASVVRGPFLSLWQRLDEGVMQDWRLAVALWTLLTVTLPNLRTWTWAQVKWALGVAEGYTDAARAAIVSWVATWIGQLVQYVNGRLAYALAVIEATRAAIVAWVAAWIGQLVQYVAAGDARVARYAEALAQGATAYAAAAVGVAVGALEGEIVRERARADAEVGALAGWAEGAVRALAGDIIGAEARAEAYALALATPLSRAISDIENSPCMRSCGPLGEIGQLLQGLEDAGFIAILLGVLEETRQHPGQVQDVLRRDVVPLGQDALGALGLGV